MVTVISIPRSGTRFYMLFLMRVLGLHVRYRHLFKENEDELVELINTTDDVIVVPVRSYEGMAMSFEPSPEYRRRLDEEFMPMFERLTDRLERAGAHFMDIEKHAGTTHQFDRLLEDLGVPWTPAVTKYIENWAPIGSQHGC